jgi:hypothetical protein
MGGSLVPEYFKPVINVAIMMGPVASTANISTKSIRLAASKIKEIEFFFVHILHYYNTFAPVPLAEEGLTIVCHFVP